MRTLIFVFFSLLITSCSQLIDEPKNLIPKDKMAEIIAELTLNEELGILDPDKTNPENATRYTLKKFNIKGDDFSESYKYYIATEDLEKILDKAQKIILEKDPAAKKYIEKKLKEKPNLPAFAR